MHQPRKNENLNVSTIVETFNIYRKISPTSPALIPMSSINNLSLPGNLNYGTTSSPLTIVWCWFECQNKSAVIIQHNEMVACQNEKNNLIVQNRVQVKTFKFFFKNKIFLANF